MFAGGLLTLADGTVKTLQPIEDAEWVESWLRRSVVPCALWSLTLPLLPIAEGLMLPGGVSLPMVGLARSGQLVALLWDLRLERPLSQVVGESLVALQWAEGLEEQTLETFARTFCRNPNISLRALYEQVYAVQSPPTLGSPAKVHVLSWRPLSEMVSAQQFLARHQLPVWFFRLWVGHSLDGEVVAMTEAVEGAPSGLREHSPLLLQRFGSGEMFLQSLQGS
ncbi:MAG: hypothetical protein SLRJCFUN_002602 [Candidatus Fervidibacter sp.]